MTALLQDAWRSLRARPGASAVAGAGLMLSLACGLLVALIAWALAAVDPAIPDPERVVLLDFRGNPPGKPGDWQMASPLVFGPLLKERQVPLDLISRLASDGIDIELSDRQQPALLLLADPDVVPLLGLRALAGDLRASLERQDGIAISRDLVLRLWGTLPPEQALGRTLVSRGRHFVVTAVVPNIDPRAPYGEANPLVGSAMAMVGFDTLGNGWSEARRQAVVRANGRVFTRLRDGVSADQVGAWMRDAYVASPGYAALPADWKAGREAAFFRALPLTRLPFEGEAGRARWFLLGSVAAACGLLLVMAAFNHMNLLSSGLLRRQRETALRRSLGADTGHVLRLWGTEAALLTTIAAAAALLVAWWVAPAAANALGLSPALPVADPVPWAVMLGLLAVVALTWSFTLTGPAWVAARRPPAPALQGRTASEGPGGRRLRQGLLALQLGGALLLSALACVLALQQRHLLQVDRGFDTNNRYWLGMMMDPTRMPPMEGLIDALNRHPAVRHWAFSSQRPGADTRGPQELHVGAAQHRQVLRISRVSQGYFDTYGMTVLAGAPRRGDGEETVVLDARAAQLLGFASPQAAVGAQIRGGGGQQEGQTLRRVVAVVKNVKLESAREPAMPQAFVVDDRPQWDLTVHGDDGPAVRAALNEIWSAHGPRVPHDIRSSRSLLADAYRQERVLATLLIGIAVLAMAVATAGGYALVADTLRRRRLELVLRRLHGADARAVAISAMREFVWPMAVAVPVALCAAVLLGQAYLSGFVDHVDVAGGLGVSILCAMLLVVAVVVVAAARHLRQALLLQPLEALG